MKHKNELFIQNITLCLLVSSGDILLKEYGRQIVARNLNQNCSDNLMVFLKDL